MKLLQIIVKARVAEIKEIMLVEKRRLGLEDLEWMLLLHVFFVILVIVKILQEMPMF